MAADASIYGLIKQQPSPVEQYGQVLNLKALMGQGKLQDLQTQAAERTAAQDTALDKVFADAPEGATLESLVPSALRASPKAGIELQGKVLDQKVKQAGLAHTQAQTGDITAGHIAGAWAALAQGGGSDESVKAAHDMMAPLVGDERATAVTQQLLSMPPQTRLAYAVAQAGQHKVGQEALKLFFPQAHMQDTGGGVTPVSTSTLPGAAPAGTPIPGTQPLPKTQSPDSAAAQSTAIRGQNMTDARQRELNGIMEGQTSTPSPALVDAIGKHEIELKPPPTNARNPIMLQRYGQTLEAVKAKYPNWGAEQFPTVKKVEASFASGPDAKTIQALSNATGHIDTYERLALALKNGDSQAVNSIVNKVRAQFGSDAPTNPQAVSQFLAGEIVKAASGAAGGVSDREHMADIFANKNSPAQMVGAANTVREIMGQQFRSLDQKYKAGTYGRTDFADKYLTIPEVRSAYDRATKAHAAPAATASTQKPGTITQPVKFLGFE